MAAAIIAEIPGMAVCLCSCGDVFGHGSRACGVARPASDVDLMIIARDPSLSEHHRGRVLDHLRWQLSGSGPSG